MTTTFGTTDQRRKRGEMPGHGGFAAGLVALDVLTLTWLAIYAPTSETALPARRSFVTLFTDPDFLDPLLTTAIIATSSALICCLPATPTGRLVSRADLPRRAVS